MPIYNLTEYSDNFAEASGSSWQNCRDEPFICNNGNILGIPGDHDTTSFNYKK